MFIVGVKVTADHWLEGTMFTRIKQELEVKKETEKQISIGKNPVGRAVIRKADEIGNIFAHSTTEQEISYYAFCHDEDADRLLALCFASVKVAVDSKYQSMVSMKKSIEEGCSTL